VEDNSTQCSAADYIYVFGKRIGHYDGIDRIAEAVLIMLARPAPDNGWRTLAHLSLLCRESVDGLLVLVRCRLPDVGFRKAGNIQLWELSLPEIN
jgi:hypothetical protein